jgi:aspartyl-tRNA(Asn)/glutamyl-tRNA(Gln) amidotransferase subunit C
MKITREEVLKIAEISKIKILEVEIENVIKHLESVLSYAERVQEIVADQDEPSNKNINVIREDVIINTDSEPILRQAPESEDNYFVVPKILND